MQGAEGIGGVLVGIYRDDGVPPSGLASGHREGRRRLLQRRFGRGLLHDAQGMATYGGELYVCDCLHDCIQVFSFTGELLRTIRGEWRRPMGILCVRDRLFVTEEYHGVWDRNEDTRPEGYSPEMGRRVFVMSTAGEALQTYSLELAAGEELRGMAFFDNLLVIKACSRGSIGQNARLISLKGV